MEVCGCEIMKCDYFINRKCTYEKPICRYRETDNEVAVTELQAENEKLKAMLKKYGKHLNTCESRYGTVHGDIPCTCGFSDVLKEVEK